MLEHSFVFSSPFTKGWLFIGELFLISVSMSYGKIYCSTFFGEIGKTTYLGYIPDEVKACMPFEPVTNESKPDEEILIIKNKEMPVIKNIKKASNEPKPEIKTKTKVKYKTNDTTNGTGNETNGAV